MILRPARLILIGLLMIMAWPNGSASTGEVVDVDEKIDRIVEPPEYDWLRRKPKPEGDGTTRPVGEGHRGEPSAKRHEQSGCDFSPTVSRSPERQSSQPKGRSCGGEPADCGSSPIGSCDCGTHIGSCNAPGVGALSSIGYLLLGLFIAFLVGLIVAAVIKRRQKEPEEETFDAESIQSPGDIRPSQVPRFAVSAMMERARAAARAGDYKNAVGFAYLAGIDHLHRAGLVDLRRSTTNLQILDAVSRKNGLHRSTVALVRTFEDLFFGDYTAEPAHWEACRAIVEEEFAETPIQD